METQELIESLKNVNINSETAEVIAKEYFRLEYIKLACREVAGWIVFSLIVAGVRGWWSKFKEGM